MFAKPGARFAEMLRTTQVFRYQRPSRAKADAFQLAKIKFFSKRIVVVKIFRTLSLMLHTFFVLLATNETPW